MQTLHGSGGEGASFDFVSSVPGWPHVLHRETFGPGLPPPWKDVQEAVALSDFVMCVSGLLKLT